MGTQGRVGAPRGTRPDGVTVHRVVAVAQHVGDDRWWTVEHETPERPGSRTGEMAATLCGPFPERPSRHVVFAGNGLMRATI